MAVFFRTNGYDKEKPAAARRYEVLEEFVTGSGINSKHDFAFESDPERLQYFNSAIFREYLRLDKALHIHKSRRRKVYDEYDFGAGRVTVTVDYDHRNVLTGEAAYTVEPAYRNHSDQGE